MATSTTPFVMARAPPLTPDAEVERGDRPRPPPSLRRDKPQLSCNSCRKRKVRCDRQSPCATCCRRGLARTCNYSNDEQEPKLSTPTGAAGTAERIHQLESLVISLMQQDKASPGCVPSGGSSISSSPRNINSQQASTSSTDLDAELAETQLRPVTAIDDGTDTNHWVVLDGGCLKFDSLGTANYVGSTHWAAVLDSITNLKEHFEQEEELRSLTTDSNSNDESSWNQVGHLLHGCQMATKAEILTSIPPRRVADRLVSRYFVLEISPGIIHSNQFLREYERFWERSFDAPTIWIGLLFTILCVGELHQSRSATGDILGTPTMERSLTTSVNVFRTRIVQCLMLDKYTKGGPHVLECLLQYNMIEHYVRQDAEFEVWIILGMLIPIALRMGLHRDSKHFSEISAFAGEMRRRVWATIFQIDVGFSALAGLPRMIKPQQCDTEEPRNLLDSDFDAESVELPPSRSESEATPILFLLAKNRIMSVGGIITDLSHDTRLYPYAELMRVENLLWDTRKSLPISLHWQPLSQSIIQSPQTIMQRVYLEIFFHKMRIVLYKKYLSISITQPQYIHARDVCLDSASRILEYQHLLDEEHELLDSIRWTYSSLLNNDFMLAASILCFYIKEYDGKDILDKHCLLNIRALLTKSHDIWLDSVGSKEAERAVESLSIVLGAQHLSGDKCSTQQLPAGLAESLGLFDNPVNWAPYGNSRN